VGGEPVRRSFLPFAVPSLGEEEEQEVLDTLRSGWLTTGHKTRRFEDACRSYLGVDHAVAMASCTGALHVALAAVGIGPGDEVVTTPISWPATANVILHLGAKPVFVDVEPDTLNIDVSLIAAAIGPRTKAILPVHMAGQSCDLDPLLAVAREHGLRVVEDAAHAFGADYRTRKIGQISDATAFSFYPTKNLTTIEGGLLATNDEELADRARILSLHGISKDAWKRYAATGSPHWQLVEPGFKYNMTDVQASVGLHQLPRFEGFLARRAEIVARYDAALADVPAIQRLSRRSYGRHVNHLYIVLLDRRHTDIERDDFIQALRSEGIGTGVHFVSMHLQPYYRETFGYRPDSFPVAADVSERIVSLPLYPAMSDRDVDDVIRAVRKIVVRPWAPLRRELLPRG
jgi:dTDP-4-amino-4,6-dideoxygalactose transaminase